MEISKNIWIINEYAGSPYYGMEFRHYYLGKELVKLGNRVTVVSSSYSHLFKNLPKEKRENLDGVDFVWLKMFNYGTSHDKRRVLKWFLFMFKIFFLPFILKKPDVIIVSPMAPFPIFPAWILSKIYKAKLIYEVKDIWPLSLVALGGFSPRHPFIRVMSWFEKFALTKSDVIVSNLQNYGEHIFKDVGLERDFKWVSNGVDLDELNHKSPLDTEVKNIIPTDKFIIGYTGTVGVANSLEYFCEAAITLGEKKDILCVIVGEGQEKQKLLEKYNQYENILFVDYIKKEQVQSMLGMFNVCYISAKKEELYKYGVSPNKLFDYMYSAKPILYAIESGKNIVDIANCGVSIESENSQAIVNGILELYNMNENSRKTLGQNAKNYVLEHFTYEKLAKKYEELIEIEALKYGVEL